VVRILKANAPSDITLPALAAQLHLEFQLNFSTPEERRVWARHSVRGCLRKLAEAGLVDRLERGDAVRRPSRWKWRSQGNAPLR